MATMGHATKGRVVRARITEQQAKQIEGYIQRHPHLKTMSSVLRYALERLVQKEQKR